MWQVKHGTCYDGSGISNSEWLEKVKQECPKLKKKIEVRTEHPYLEPSNQLVWEMFWTISDSRPFGAMGGAGPVPFSEITILLTEYQILDTETRFLIRHLLREMDKVYLQEIARMQKILSDQRNKKKS